MMVADLMCAALVLTLSVTSLFGHINLLLLSAIAASVALVSSCFDPALQATLPAIVPEAALRHATNALFDATRRAARILGPGMIALLSSCLPTGQFFTITAATFLLSALTVRAAIKPGLSMLNPDSGRSAAILDSLTGGWQAVKQHPVLRFGLCANLIGNVAWGMGILLGMMLLLRQNSQQALTDYSMMMMGYGIGNLVANLIIGSMRPRSPAGCLIASKLIFGLGVCLLPLMHDRSGLMLVAAFAALNGPFETLAMLQLFQSELPPQRIAQAYRLQMCAVFAGLLLAYLAAPALFGCFGLKPVIIASGAATVAVGLCGMLYLLRRQTTIC